MYGNEDVYMKINSIYQNEVIKIFLKIFKGKHMYENVDVIYFFIC